VLFTEPTFLFLFLPLLLALYFLRRPHAAYANWLLLIASVIFYAKGGGAFTWLIFASIIFNYWIAIQVDRAHARSEQAARRLVGVAVTVNLLVLVYYKYANFVVDNVNGLLAFGHIEPFAMSPVLLPIGISFFTFHAISYVVDVYRRDASAQKSPVHAALYLLLFPQLVAGPIIRYREISDQLARRRVTLDGFAEGARRFIIGLGKKTLVANIVAGPADAIFGMPAAQLDAPHAWLGIVCYTLQIYFDFSGYSDMAIGLGRMFGFRFPENFRWPYIAASVQEFWRRWHISLSSWFRDYLYVPLGGNRGGAGRTYVNLVTVFFLCGLWHGASWNFVAWGLFHGAFLVFERLGLGRILEEMPPQIRHVYTLLVVMIGWVFFRAETLTYAWAYLQAMFGLRHASELTPFTMLHFLNLEAVLAMVVGIIGSMPVVGAVRRVKDRWYGEAEATPAAPGGPAVAATRWTAFGLDLLGTAALMGVFFASVLQVAARSYNPFIYFRF
jgi:alginate O-acetyltransferase complex protein AlgI